MFSNRGASHLFSFAILLTSLGAFADLQGPYVGERVIEARFGPANARTLLSKAEKLSSAINRFYFGQPEVSRFVERKAIDFAMNLHKSPKPTIINLLGMYGTGKSDLVSILKKELGIEAIDMDVQKYATDQKSFAGKLREAVKKPLQENRPVILGIHEVDKIFEVTEKSEGGRTHPIIGVINQIVENGTISMDDADLKPLELKNVLVVLTMNFPDADLHKYAGQIAGDQPKSFYESSWDDLKKIDGLLRQGESQKFEMLSRMFRAHTVSRLAPRTIIMNSWLSPEDRQKIVLKVFSDEATKFTSSDHGKLSLKWSESIADHITQSYTYAPGGTRGLMAFAQTIFNQAVHAALRVDANPKAAARPREIELNLAEDSTAITASIQTWKRVRGQEQKDQSLQIRLPFTEDGRDLIIPKLDPMPVVASQERLTKDGKVKPFTKKQILAARFPEITSQLKTLPAFLSSRLFGREKEIATLAKRLGSYMRRDGPSRGAPDFLVWSGMQGIGKSELPELAAKHLGIPIKVINLQDYQSNEDEAKSNLESKITLLNDEVVSEKGFSGKYILMFDEADKLREINEKGEIVDRPAMSVVKSILSRGVLDVASKDGEIIKVSLRGAFLVFNMNFGRDIMGFSADPRLTNAQDIEEAMHERFKSPDLIAQVFKELFLPETFNRFSPYLHIVAPLKEEHFKQIARRSAGDAVNEFFQTIQMPEDPDYDDLTGTPEENNEAMGAFYHAAREELDRQLSSVAEKSPASVEVHFTPEYLGFLYENSIVPSEGGRFTSYAVKAQVSSDIDSAMKAFSRSSPYALVPVLLTLKFDAKTSTVSSVLLPKSDLKAEPFVLEHHAVIRSYPPLLVEGPVKPERVNVAIHEFGHALMAVETGMRINNVLVEHLVSGAAGYVDTKEDLPLTANLHLAEILMSLGSRAMERVIKAKDPKHPFSVFDASTAGASSDIAMATKGLYKILHTLGLNPFGGTIDRLGGGMTPYANFVNLPQHEVHQLERILRMLEDEMVNDLLEWYPRSWYVEKIIHLARHGVMNEAQFYELLGYPHPGNNEIFLGDSIHAIEGLSDLVEAEPESVQKAREFKRTSKGITPEATLNHYRDLLFKGLEPKTASSGCMDVLASR